MQDITATALITAAALLGCFHFMRLFAGEQNESTWEQVTTTAGVTSFLWAIGISLERSGIVAAALLLLLTWLANDTAVRHNTPKCLLAICAWLSAVLLLAYVGYEQL